MKLFNVQETETILDGVVDAKVEIRKKEYSLIDPEKHEDEVPLIKEEQKEIEVESQIA